MDLINTVNQQNLHWQFSPNISLTPKIHRDLFDQLVSDLSIDLMSLITGTRRTGKSILLLQLRDHLIQNLATSSRQILSFEFPPTGPHPSIIELVDYFKTNVADPKQKMYILFDEIQFVKNYESDLKQIYDLNKGRTKIVLTGSFSLSYKKRMSESLAGRFLSYQLFPLKFSEYLKLSNSPLLVDFTAAKIETDHLKRLGLLDQLNPEFRNFLSSGRLPEMIALPKTTHTNYLTTVLDQCLGQDAFSYFDIEKPQVLRAIYSSLQTYNGQLVNFTKLASLSQTQAKTISRYLDCLDIMGLAYFVYNSTNPLIKLNSAKKVYISSHFFLSNSKLDYDTSIGLAVESYILERLLEQNRTITFYYNRGQEIDFLLPNENLAYEIKFRTQVSKSKNIFENYELRTISPTGLTPACLF